jgi:hypothetical protein
MKLWVLVVFPTVASAVPVQVPYSGRVLTAAGLPVDGPVSLDVRLFPSDIATTPSFDEVFSNTPVDAGYFHVVLGANALDPLDSASLGDAAWVELRVNGALQGARTPLGASPFAARAHDAARIAGVPVSGTPTNGQVLSYATSTGQWAPASASAIAGYKPGASNMAVFASSGTWAVPSGVTRVHVRAWGAGGGGASGGCNTGYGGGGGGAGGYSEGFVDVTGPSVAVTVGTGGPGGGAVNCASGQNGGQTSFGTLVVANGGTGSPTNGGAGGGASGTGSLVLPGGAGEACEGVPVGSNYLGGDGGDAPLGGGGGRANSFTGTGYGGVQPGGGGAGGMRVGTGYYAGGAGANGLLIVTW